MRSCDSVHSTPFNILRQDCSMDPTSKPPRASLGHHLTIFLEWEGLLGRRRELLFERFFLRSRPSHGKCNSIFWTLSETRF